MANNRTYKSGKGNNSSKGEEPKDVADKEG